MKRTCMIFALLILGWAVLMADDDTATVFEVLDVGTYRVEYKGNEETLRLIGIHVPEKTAEGETAADDRDNGPTENDRQKALDQVKLLVQFGCKIRLEFDMDQRDRRDRLLAYAYLPDNSMLNYAVILQGWAEPRTEAPNLKYDSIFKRAYRDAVAHNRGLWIPKTPME